MEMKKTPIVKLFLIFVCMLLILMINVRSQSAWYYDDINRTGSEHQTQGSWTGNLIRTRDLNFTIMNIFKYSPDTATICSVFGDNESPVIQLSNNFTFDGDNCSITYDFQPNTTYIIATYDTDYSYEQYYDLTDSPKSTENLDLWVYATWNQPTTWTTIKTYTGSFFETEEYHYVFEGEVEVNITPNITSNDTGNRTCDYCHYYRNAGDFYELMPVLILYIFLMIFGYLLIRSGSYLSGLVLILFTIFLDFFLVGYMYYKYVDGFIIGNDIESVFNYIFGFGLILWIFIKAFVVLSMKVIKNQRRL